MRLYLFILFPLSSSGLRCFVPFQFSGRSSTPCSGFLQEIEINHRVSILRLVPFLCLLGIFPPSFQFQHQLIELPTLLVPSWQGGFIYSPSALAPCKEDVGIALAQSELRCIARRRLSQIRDIVNSDASWLMIGILERYFNDIF